MADEFMRAVATITAEDRELRDALYGAEKQVRESSSRMQGDLNKVAVTMQSTGTKGASLGQIFSGIGAQASAMGGAVGQAGGAVASLGGAFSSMGMALFGLPGLLMAAVGALGLITKAFFDAREEARKLKQELTALSVSMVERADAALSTTKALAAELAGPAAKVMHDHEVAMSQLDKERASLLPTTGMLDLPPETLDKMYAAYEELGRKREMLIVQFNTRMDALHQKALDDRIKREKDAADREIAIAKETFAKRQALMSFLATVGQKLKSDFAASPGGKLLQFIAQERAREAERSTISQLLGKMHLSPDMLAKVQMAFGLTGAVPGIVDTAGAPRGSGISSNAYAFGYAAMGSGGGVSSQTRGVQLAEKTAKGVEAVAENTNEMRLSLKAMEHGARG